jgi:hypothetical protein
LTAGGSVFPFCPPEGGSEELSVLAAARIGGIPANASRPADFRDDNLTLQDERHSHCPEIGVRKLLFLGSSHITGRSRSRRIYAHARPKTEASPARMKGCWGQRRPSSPRAGLQYTRLVT